MTDFFIHFQTKDELKIWTLFIRCWNNTSLIVGDVYPKNNSCTIYYSFTNSEVLWRISIVTCMILNQFEYLFIQNCISISIVAWMAFHHLNAILLCHRNLAMHIISCYILISLFFSISFNSTAKNSDYSLKIIHLDPFLQRDLSVHLLSCMKW